MKSIVQRRPRVIKSFFPLTSRLHAGGGQHSSLAASCGKTDFIKIFQNRQAKASVEVKCLFAVPQAELAVCGDPVSHFALDLIKGCSGQIAVVFQAQYFAVFFKKSRCPGTSTKAAIVPSGRGQPAIPASRESPRRFSSG